MAGKILYSVVFVESSGVSGNCSPADSSTETWDATRQAKVLQEISDAFVFWTGRANSPNLLPENLSFQADNLGPQPTSCEPITRPRADERKWIPDVLTALGYPATPATYVTAGRSLISDRRAAQNADWGFIILVVDSLNANGTFTDGYFAYAYLNGPFMVMTYDNDGYSIDRMNIVAAHETGHIFGAYDEYAGSGCNATDTFGYLNVPNSSCNNGGNTSDVSIMGEYDEQVDPNTDVSQSARAAIGWRAPTAGEDGKTVVDVVRNGGTILNDYTGDPTDDTTPTYTGTATTFSGYPPGGCNSNDLCHYPTSVSKVQRVDWDVDGGAFTNAGVNPGDGAFDQQGEFFSFTPPSPVPYGIHVFGTRMVNNFGYATLDLSPVATDILTICDPPWTTPVGDQDCDGFETSKENAIGTLALVACGANAWPPDFNDTQYVAINDVLAMKPHYNLTVPPAPARFNLAVDGAVNISDVLALKPYFNSMCS